MSEMACSDKNDRGSSGILLRIINNRVLFAFILVLFLFIFGEIIVPGFIKFNHIMSVLQASFFLGIISLGQTIVVISGDDGVDLSVGAVLTLGVVIGAAVINGDNGRVLYAILAAVSAGFIVGMVNGIGVSILKISPLIMTMSWGIVIEGGILFAIKGHMYGTGSSFLDMIGNGHFTIPASSGGSFTIPYVLFIWVVLILLAVFILKRTRVGFILYAIGENDNAARLQGIRTGLVRILVYGISGLLSCLTGILLLGYVGSAHLNLGNRYILPSIVAVVIGGTNFGGGAGSYIGTVGGAIFLTTLQSILVTQEMSEGSKQVVTGLVLLLLLILYNRKKQR